MVSTSALRETIVLIIFGIVLVPIAAKRAQDAPGYWKAFAANAQQSLVYHGRQPSSSAFTLTAETACDAALCSSLAKALYPVQNDTVSVNCVTKESRPEPRGPFTVRFHMSKPEMAASATMTEIGAKTGTAEAPRGAMTTEVKMAASPTTTTTSAANRERWTLIWMGSAIAAVALFMSSC